MNDGDYSYVIMYATRLISDVRRMTKRVPGKESIIANCCSVLGNAYLETRDDKKALSFHMEDFRLGDELYAAAWRGCYIDATNLSQCGLA